MMRRLAARKNDSLYGSSNSINTGSSTDNLHHIMMMNNTSTSPRRSSNNKHKLAGDDDATAKSRHASIRSIILRLYSQLIQIAHSLFHRFKCYLERIDPIYAAVICIFIFVTICTLIVIETFILIGPRGSIKGGAIGIPLDLYVRDYTRYQTMSKWKQQVKSELNLPIVYKEQDGALTDQRWYPFGDSLLTRPNFAIVEMLLREKRRKDRLGTMIQDAVKDGMSCSKSMRVVAHPQRLPITVLQLQTNDGQQLQMMRLLPYWLKSIPAFKDVEIVTIDNSDIDPTNSDLREQLLQLELNRSKEPRRKEDIPYSIQNCPTFIAQKNNYALRTDPMLHCVGYYLGGIQLTDDDLVFHQARPYITAMFTSSLYTHATKTSCSSKVGYTVLSHTPKDEVRKSSSVWNHVSTIFSAVPPSHPAYLCLPPLLPSQVGISPYNTANEELSYQSTFVNKLLTAYESKRLETSSSESILAGVATLPCEFNRFNSVDHAAKCCNQVSVTMLDSTEGTSMYHYLKQNNREDTARHHLVFSFANIPEMEQKSNPNIKEESTQVSVLISEKKVRTMKKQKLQYKESIQKQMRHKSWTCESGWWCNRCLQTSIYGSFSKCSFVCGKCAPEFICNGREKETQIDINAKVSGLNLSQLPIPSGHHHYQRIPRIIHQTYFEDITKETFPQLVRLQNTWKASGWEYRFYSDDTARDYIRSHYPERFVSVFDTLLPGAYKADFFRYLVLFQDGGIYADIDVMLDANLDSFLTPDLAFFAPIDSVGVYADETFCLWNGLIGSAPAHPILANVIERMVNLVSSRADLYDVERAVCEVTGMDKMENWKIRAEPGLILTGPCALGLAANDALGNNALSRFVPGLMSASTSGNSKHESNDVIGDVMILVVSLGFECM